MYPVLDRFIAIEKVICSILSGVFFVFPNICSSVGTEICESHLRPLPEFGTFFFLCITGYCVCVRVCCVYVCTCVRVCARADGRRSEGREDNVESSQSFHLLLRHRSFMAAGLDKASDEASRKTDKSANTKVDYDFSRGHRSRLLLRPVHTHERVHRFFLARRVHWTNLNIERVTASYYVLLLLSTLRDSFFSHTIFFLFFYFDTDKILV